MYYQQSKPTENLFLNTLPFAYPVEPVTFYFTKEFIPGLHLKPLSHDLFPLGVETIFPDITNADKIYTTFTEPADGLTPLAIEFRKSANYNLVKRYYNGRINYFLKSRGLPVETTFIKDNQAWVMKQKSKRPDCTQYERFTLKFDYDYRNQHPHLILSYDRPSLVYKKSVADILNQDTDVPFSEDESNATPHATPDIFSKIFYFKKLEEDNKWTYRIESYDYLSQHLEGFDSKNAYPVMWPKLDEFLGAGTEEEDEDDIYIPPKKSRDFRTSRYRIYYEKIKWFYESFLNNDEFRAIFPIARDGFATVNKGQIGMVHGNSNLLEFGENFSDRNPQQGINHGPYSKPKASHIQMVGILHADDKDLGNFLLVHFCRDKYGYFEGLKKYTGLDVTWAPRDKHIFFTDKANPLPEIRQGIAKLQPTEGVVYVGLYLTPVGKHTSNKQAKEIYYQVKKELLDAGIQSQCIETAKMRVALKGDEGVNERGYPKRDFAYTLQNMAIAINAKLGGTPWQLAADKTDELIIGVGAFKVGDVKYIGSAFSFDNTGHFNAFDYFLSNQTQALAGAIENAIHDFAKDKDGVLPERIIIHYYKVMSKEEEYGPIEKMLAELDMEDTPVYVVTINKTESEDIVLFDGYAKPEHFMPRSGRYANLGNKTYLLCNNSNYENAGAYYGKEGYPFPVKLRISCPYYDDDIDDATIRDLIDQVYQFSRIYWKSVKQQNLPVTIKYPEMVAEIAPHFNGENIPEHVQDSLWFL
jgi:hypothetical protein